MYLKIKYTTISIVKYNRFLKKYEWFIFIFGKIEKVRFCNFNTISNTIKIHFKYISENVKRSVAISDCFLF